MARRVTPVDSQERHVRREGLTMALYVSITLLAALSVAADEETDDVDVLAIIWGTTVGLALAHWFAFSLAVRLLDPMAEDPGGKEQLVAQLTAAVAVAAVASVPVLLLPTDVEQLGARGATAGCIGYVAYGETRNFGGSKARALSVAAIALAVGSVVAGVKHAQGH
jgi:hypothetical protein